jgi:putative oxidoreductase
MKTLIQWYARFAAAASYLQSPFLFVVRVYFGWQLMTNGWGKLHNLAGFAGYFASLNIPFPSLNAHFVAGLECFGSALLILGLGSRLIALLIAGDMFVAYWAGDHEALRAFFSDPDKFAAAAPFVFLIAALIVLCCGPGLFSLDALIARKLKVETP